MITASSVRDRPARPPAARARFSGAHLVCAALRAQGVDVIFGYPGGAQLPINQELANWHGRLRHVLVRHEQNAAHAADGYARASGKVGVCLATSGPGATNLVTGLATAWMDGVPLLAITGQVPTAAIGTLAFQEVDIVAVARPVTKATLQARRLDEVPELLARALRIATEGRPGPVVLDLPKDVLTATIDWSPDEQVSIVPPAVVGPALPDTVGLVSGLLQGAERPLLLAGHGVIRAGASAALRELAERIGAPVATTLLGLGAFPEDHPQALGMAGMHGTVEANLALDRADLIVGLGARFDDRVVGRPQDFAPRATVVHVDVDPAAFGRVVRCDVPVLCDVGLFLQALAAEPGWGAPLAWRRWLEGLRVAHRACGEGPLGRLTSPDVIRALRAASDEHTTVVADVGQHQMFVALYWQHTNPGRFFTSGGLGTMGYALGAAMGAQLARPGGVTWAAVGDGGFQMSAPELATLVAERIPVKVAIFNNRCLGMVRQWQEFFHQSVHENCDLPQPDFAALARAHGCFAQRVDTPAEVAPAIAAALAVDGPAVLDFQVEHDETVYPMVPPGASCGEVVCREGRVAG